MATKGADKKAGADAVMALSPFQYDEETGPMVRGQVFHLRGHVNDHLLSGMDYVAAVDKGTTLVECGECGALFVDDFAREKHGQHFHGNWCQCGWKPAAHVYDKDDAMKKHMQTCEAWRQERQVAHKQRLEAATA